MEIRYSINCEISNIFFFSNYPWMLKVQSCERRWSTYDYILLPIKSFTSRHRPNPLIRGSDIVSWSALFAPVMTPDMWTSKNLPSKSLKVMLSSSIPLQPVKLRYSPKRHDYSNYNRQHAFQLHLRRAFRCLWQNLNRSSHDRLCEEYYCGWFD